MKFIEFIPETDDVKLNLTEFCRKTGEFEPIDLAFADFLLRFARTPECEELYLAGLFASRAVRLSHSCCSLEEIAGKPFPEIPVKDYGQIKLYFNYEDWQEQLKSPSLSFYSDSKGDVDNFLTHYQTPLVIDEKGRLYLQRYLYYELQLAKAIIDRVKPEDNPPELSQGYLENLFAKYRSGAEPGKPDYQRLAVLAAASRNFCIISGGPGTGKTTVVAALLALEFERAKKLRVALCAPTGKAAARLGEALQEDGKKIGTTETIRERITELVPVTIDRLISSRPLTHQTKYNAENPLPFDLVIVDESSMVSLPLMARLTQALAPKARLILLGDPYQLASVESGAVLADICESVESNAFSPSICEAYEKLSPKTSVNEATDQQPLAGSVAELTHNFRFDSALAIGEISSEIKELGSKVDPAASIVNLTNLIHQQQNTDFSTFTVNRDQLAKKLEDELKRNLPDNQGGFLRLKELAKNGTEADLKEAFELLEAFRVLSPVRQGPFGVVELNQLIRKIFDWPSDDTPGMPVMILANDHSTGLSNGDIGLFWRDFGGSDTPRIYFSPDLSKRSFIAAELPEHEPVFAMTVHKSQGSGFKRVLLVLPDDKDSPVLTRELLYTGITRASKEVVLWSTPNVTSAMLARRTRRDSGLQDRLIEVQEFSSSQQQ